MLLPSSAATEPAAPEARSSPFPGTEKSSLLLTKDPGRQAEPLLGWEYSWDAIWGKKACNVFLAKVGFLLTLIFVLELLSNTEWISGRRSHSAG